MADRQRQYWLHRITGGSNALPVAKPLLEKELYLSIGWSDLSSDVLVKEAIAENWDKVRELFKDEGYSLAYSAWNLIRFVKDMQPGDYVVVPSWGKFSVFEIADDTVYTNESCSGIHFEDWNGYEPHMEDGYWRTKEGNIIDLGFYRKVKPVEVDIPRAEYAEAALISRMKIRQTNACINDLEKAIITAIEAYRTKKPINLKSKILENIIENTFEQIKKTLNPDKLEDLVEWYMKSLGAEWVITPAKNVSPTEQGDADIEARFEKLKLIIMVQVKKHDGTTDAWAVKQIKAYEENNHRTDEYTTIMWVISTCEDFSPEAKKMAEEGGIRLINGREFTQLILESGLKGMDI